jgi:hypothetical protein
MGASSMNACFQRYKLAAIAWKTLMRLLTFATPQGRIESCNNTSDELFNLYPNGRVSDTI